MSKARKRSPRRCRVKAVVGTHFTERAVVIDEEAAEARTLAAKLAQLYAKDVKFYISSLEQTSEQARTQVSDLRKWKREQVEKTPPKELDWHHLDSLAEVDIRAALDAWENVKAAARDELVSGARSATAIHAASPYEQAQFSAIRDQFVDAWNPQGGIEYAMVEILAQTFSLHLYWTQIAHGRATRTADEQRDRISSMESTGWRTPFQLVADAIDQSHRLADGYHRQFMRTVRQMRDLRRYAPPVIVNQSGGQVNVANQQVNVSEQGLKRVLA